MKLFKYAMLFLIGIILFISIHEGFAVGGNVRISCKDAYNNIFCGEKNSIVNSDGSRRSISQEFESFKYLCNYPDKKIINNELNCNLEDMPETLKYINNPSNVIECNNPRINQKSAKLGDETIYLDAIKNACVKKENELESKSSLFKDEKLSNILNNMYDIISTETKDSGSMLNKLNRLIKDCKPMTTHETGENMLKYLKKSNIVQEFHDNKNVHPEYKKITQHHINLLNNSSEKFEVSKSKYTLNDYKYVIQKLNKNIRNTELSDEKNDGGRISKKRIILDKDVKNMLNHIDNIHQISDSSTLQNYKDNVTAKLHILELYKCILIFSVLCKHNAIPDNWSWIDPNIYKEKKQSPIVDNQKYDRNSDINKIIEEFNKNPNHVNRKVYIESLHQYCKGIIEPIQKLLYLINEYPHVVKAHQTYVNSRNSNSYTDLNEDYTNYCDAKMRFEAFIKTFGGLPINNGKDISKSCVFGINPTDLSNNDRKKNECKYSRNNKKVFEIWANPDDITSLDKKNIIKTIKCKKCHEKCGQDNKCINNKRDFIFYSKDYSDNSNKDNLPDKCNKIRDGYGCPMISKKDSNIESIKQLYTECGYVECNDVIVKNTTGNNSTFDKCYNGDGFSVGGQTSNFTKEAANFLANRCVTNIFATLAEPLPFVSILICAWYIYKFVKKAKALEKALKCTNAQLQLHDIDNVMSLSSDIDIEELKKTCRENCIGAELLDDLFHCKSIAEHIKAKHSANNSMTHNVSNEMCKFNDMDVDSSLSSKNIMPTITQYTLFLHYCMDVMH